MSNTIPRTPDASREQVGVQKIVDNLKVLFGGFLTTEMESSLSKISRDVLVEFGKLLNPETNGTKEIMIQRLIGVLNKQ